jgi:hypothetical protein
MLGSARIAALACAAAVVLPRSAAAQKVPPAFTERYNAGQTAYHSGNFDEARKQFEAARAVRNLPGPYRWLAATALAQGRLEDCIAKARGYLQLAPTGGQAAAVRALHDQCRRGLDRPAFDGDLASSGAIWIEGRSGDLALEGVTVRLNGLRYGATPMAPRSVALGAVEVTLEAPGYLPATASAVVLPGIVTDVVVELVRDPTAAAQEPTEAEPASGEDIDVGWLRLDTNASEPSVTVDGAPPRYDGSGRIEAEPGLRLVEIKAQGREPWSQRVRFVRGQERRVQSDLQSSEQRRRDRRNGYLALGVAAAAVASGAVFGILEGREFERAEDIWDVETQRPGDGGFEATIPIRTRDEIEDHRTRGRTYALVSAASFGAAAVGLGASIVFFLAERPAALAGAEPPIAVTPVTGPDGLAGAAITYTGALGW